MPCQERPGEEALDPVGVDPLALLIGDLVVHPSQPGRQAAQFIVSRMLIGNDTSALANMMPDQVPGAVCVLAPDNPGHGPAFAITLAGSHHREPLARLVLDATTIDPIRFAVPWSDMAAHLHRVDLDSAFQHHAKGPRRQRLADLHEENPRGLVLNPDLAGQKQRRLALH